MLKEEEDKTARRRSCKWLQLLMIVMAENKENKCIDYSKYDNL